ncbi:SpoIIE family protein phosphatase [Streptomyces asiaticus]
MGSFGRRDAQRADDVAAASSPFPPRRRPGSPRGVGTVAGQVFVLQLVIVLVLIAVGVAALFLQARDAAMRDARHRSLAAAQTFASAPGTVAAAKSTDPSAVLQPRAEEARKKSGVDYIVAFSPSGVRWTSPRPQMIGSHVTGSYAEALRGRPDTSTFDSPIGRVVDTTVPITDVDGSVVGLVGVGLTVGSVNEQVRRQLPLLIGSTAGAFILVTGSTALVSRRLRTQTFGLGPAELARMYEHHDAVLHSVREGVAIVGKDGRLLLANDEARRLLDLPHFAEQQRLADLGLEPRLVQLLSSGREATDEAHLAGDRLLAVNVRPIAMRGAPAGSVATLRDSTELRALAGRAEAARERLALLYDAGLRVGTTLDVRRTAEELAEVAAPRFADIVTVELLEPVLRGDEPTDGSTEMLRTAVSGVHGATALYPPGERIRFLPTTPMARSVTQGRPVLAADLRTADAWQSQDPERAERVLRDGIRSLVVAPLQARGVVLGAASFWRTAASAPFEQEDLAFAEELTARAALAVDNARRYTREHATAVALQQSLLPRRLADPDAVEVAYRYLPAQSGVGGDWFDVIPLPGARVALVVGDVVGHGLHAAATMGRLRTAVHNFSALDLAPEELLSHLDELVTRIDSEESTTGADEEPSMTGATCLYAVYDPIAGRVAIATAGHPVPAIAHPDGRVSCPDVPVSPPLGLGSSLPFEGAELDVPAGSRLVLFTDGLIENRHRDVDTGRKMLHEILAGAARDPDATCAAVIEAMLPEHQRDDVALLVARTHRLDATQVAHWDVASDLAGVATVRASCGRQLQDWGLEEISFTTELILSELVTNAIRYGSQPISVRLIHVRTLICEVFDGSSTAPHLRRAALTDEGGRGLFLVAQLFERWGTRYFPRGKVIWAEQALHGEPQEPGSDLGSALLDQWDDL